MRPDLECDALHLGPHGAERFVGALAGAALSELEAVLAKLDQRPGVRLHGVSGLEPLLALDGPVGAVACQALGPAARPVRAVLFDKTPAANWSLGWHQDRTIVVRTRIETTGFGPWSVKQRLQHVEPPFEIIEAMVTLRVHLDATPINNAPLLIAPGSHLMGRIPLDQIAETVDRCGNLACLAEPGDVWAYSTPILHASNVSTSSGRRRVLQIDYADRPLPNGLEWLGV